MLELNPVRVLTVDCYGTLIDWEMGIAEAVTRLLDAHAIVAERDAILELHARFESAAQRGSFKPYREVLAEVVDRFGEHYGFEPSATEREALAGSIAAWPAFADTVAALGRLAEHYKLAILSNIDDDLIAPSTRRLEVDFEWVVTAQQVGSYKPAPGHFEAALERFGVAREQILHVAQSLYHDIGVARELGFATVWVNRRRDQAGEGATPPAQVVPDLEVPDLASLAALVG
ncbi:MAG: haloacid dehalogenase type II [Acidobacteria bacterium]|nr:haloacid dehalogenase type II [Acidobacteriota bacterium]